jgi:hypothetical protein
MIRFSCSRLCSEPLALVKKPITSGSPEIGETTQSARRQRPGPGTTNLAKSSVQKMIFSLGTYFAGDYSSPKQITAIQDPTAKDRAMAMREIPRDEWGPFFDEFSRNHVDDEVTVEEREPDAGTHNLARDLPLQGITAVTSGQTNEIEIITNDTQAGVITHVVKGPTHVRIDDTGEEHLIEIEATDGAKTLVHY